MQDEDLENYKGMTAEEILQAQTPAEKTADVIDKEVTSSMEADTASGEDEAVPEPTGEEESQESSDENSDDSMSIIDHLTELRSRLIRSIIAVIACSCITYFFDEQIMGFLMAPAGKLYFMQPGEAFFSYAKVVLFSGFLLATPVVFYQLWRFFVPAFTRRERMILGILVPSSVLLFYAGLAFSFFFIVPFGIKFFMGMGSEDLTPLFSVEKYLDFIITFLLPFGLAFELPIIIIIMAQLGLMTSQKMKKYFRYVFFVSFIVAALLTPPDIISQITLALPLTALYALSYFVVRFILRK